MLRKTIHRPNHKERAQPLEREKWGLLEKHKDYSLRAKDFKEKKKRLQTLRQKAAERNPDEFHYGMLSSKSKNGRKITERGSTVLSQDAAKLFKTQDSGYLRSMLQRTRRAIEKLEQEFVLRGEEGPEVLGESEDQKEAQHLIFVNSQEEQKQYQPGRSLIGEPSLGSFSQGIFTDRLRSYEKEDPIRKLQAHPQLSRNPPQSRKAAQREIEASKQEMLFRKQRRKEQNAQRTKLIALKSREKDLIDAENELEHQRARMSNTVGGVTKAGKTWRIRERKK